MNRFYFLILTSLLSCNIFAQELGIGNFAVELQKDTTNSNGYYTSILYAEKHPELVKLLDIEKQDVTLFLSETEKFQNLEGLIINFSDENLNYTSLTKLAKLLSLEIYYSPIYFLPDDLFKNSSIKKINFTSCRLKGIPKSLFTNNIVEKIILKGNYISILPNKISNDNNIKILSLKQNNLKKLPMEFKNLQKLEFLNLSINHLDSLPLTVVKLKNLKILNIGFNPITYLPKEIIQLKKLETLYITETKITSLPTGMKKMKKLANIYITDYNLTSEQKETIKNSLPKKCKITWTNEDFYHSLEF